MPREPSPFRRTVFDLYIEKERLPWYYRTSALIASWLALGGYILSALVFTSEQNNLQTSRTVLTSLAVALLVLGYLTAALVAWLSHSLLFTIEAVLFPLTTSSFMGIVAVVFNHALHKSFSIPNLSYIYAPLVTAIVTTVTCFALLIISHRRISSIKESDNRRGVSRLSQGYADSNRYSSTAELVPLNMQIPEDDAQRKQLLRLLLKREAARAASPENGSTYHIDLPPALAETLPPQYSHTRHLSVPNIYDEGTTRGRRTSTQPKRPLSGLLGPLAGLGARSRSSTGSESFKDPRETRRDQIEQQGVSDTQSGMPLLTMSQTPPAQHPQAWYATRYG